MIGLLQRVSEAAVTVAGEEIAAIGRGILVLVGVERGDTDAAADRLAERLLGYRVFADADGKMNRDVADIDGGVLLVSQFTLAADTAKGRRASFTTAAPPAEAERLFDRLVTQVRRRHRKTATGRFGADMQVRLVNDGPVTFRLRVEP
ncbi:MAG TPA: D-aminoacyl-tRNA deacylase [Gammaproteobacteria bacterium]|nr:D-aminoacyl-tRNA deacylase [Gammaproteobacteria bacterium]HET7587073.1 D-aminoacyl-tRNA deacylase [Gammaproteobacteria bacterium]